MLVSSYFSQTRAQLHHCHRDHRQQVCVFMYIYIYIYICVCVSAYPCVRVCVSIPLPTHTYTEKHTHTLKNTHTHTHTHTHIQHGPLPQGRHERPPLPPHTRATRPRPPVGGVVAGQAGASHCCNPPKYTHTTLKHTQHLNTHTNT